MIKVTYPVSEQDKILISGPGEVNLMRLEETYQLKTFTRNSGIVLQAEQKECIKLATKALDRFKKIIDTGQELSKFLVEQLIKTPEMDKNENTAAEFEHLMTQPLLFDRWGKSVHPRNSRQAQFLSYIEKSDITLCAGSAGTGKTFLSVAMAVSFLQNKKASKIILVRPAVESGEYLGFLPGDLREKIAPYMTPLFDALNILIHPDKLEELRRNGEIEIAPLAYMRGRTLDNCFIILDEAQNITISQMKMFLTRIGVRSKTVVVGDETQIDLPQKEKSGLPHARALLKDINGLSQIVFTHEDIVRHRIVKDILKAYDSEIIQK